MGDSATVADGPGRTGEVSTGAPRSAVVVFQDRQWFAAPRMGAFVVQVDHRRAGVAPVNGELVVPVAPGVHTVRVRQGRFRSPPVEVTVAEGAVVRLHADIPLHLGLLARMVLFLRAPSRCLLLTPTEPGWVQEGQIANRVQERPVRLGLVAAGLVSLLGAVLMVVGATRSPGVVLLGLVFMFAAPVGFFWWLRRQRNQS